MSAQPFHLALPVNDLEEGRAFYCGVLGCSVGREDEAWIDYDFFGHQLTTHYSPAAVGLAPTNSVDGDAVPVRHFGVVLAWDDWEALAAELRLKGLPFLVEPHVRFVGQPGEQGTFFVRDPSGNALEFKSFRDLGQLFAPQ